MHLGDGKTESRQGLFSGHRSYIALETETQTETSRSMRAESAVRMKRCETGECAGRGRLWWGRSGVTPHRQAPEVVQSTQQRSQAKESRLCFPPRPVAIDLSYVISGSRHTSPLTQNRRHVAARHHRAFHPIRRLCRAGQSML